MENNPEIKRKTKIWDGQISVQGISTKLDNLEPSTRIPSEWKQIQYKASTKKVKKNEERGRDSSQEIPINVPEDCVFQLSSPNYQVALFGHTSGVKNIAPTTSRVSVSP